VPRLIAEQSTHLLRFSRPHGRRVARSIGGSGNGGNGSAGYAVQTAVNGGSELLIFVPPKASD
jgi:hypothetical protein